MKIVVFTGAGVSRESGLKTFRDSVDGLWEGYDVMQVASIKGWWADPATVLDFYNFRRREVKAASPNEAHLALAELEAKHDVTVITQNVDDLHERAGSKNVIHLHGHIFYARPDGEEGPIIPWREDIVLGDQDPETGKQLRPNIVWFGEGLPEIERAMEIALAPDVDVLIVCGTTLQVYPAAMIATDSRAARIVLVDPNPPELDRANVKYIRLPASQGIRNVVDQLI